MAPEHHHHPDKVDARVDLFALGLIGLELLSGERAMTVSSVEGLEVAWSALTSKVAALNCGVATRELIGGLLQRDPDARPKDAAETLRAIRQRLIELEIADYERPVASVFAAAFERLDRAQSSFDQTLSDGLIQLNPNVPGTASLPGISFASKGSDATPAPAAPQLDVTPAEVTSRRSPRASRMRWVVVLVLGLGLLFRESLFELSSPPSPEAQATPALREPAPSPIAESSRAPRRPSELALPATETAKRAPAAKGVEAAAPSAAREQPTVKAEVAVAPPPQAPGRRPRPVNTAKAARSGHLVFRVLLGSRLDRRAGAQTGVSTGSSYDRVCIRWWSRPAQAARFVAKSACSLVRSARCLVLSCLACCDPRQSET